MTNQKRLEMISIAHRLSELENARGVKQREVAAGIGMLEQTYSSKKKGRRPWSVGELAALADFFGVSVDYLLGRSPLATAVAA